MQIHRMILLAAPLFLSVLSVLPEKSDQAEIFAPGVISDQREQYRIAFTASGDTAYFAAGDGFFPQTRQATIYRSVRVDGRWQPPEIASFSGNFPDLDPFISPDGRRLYFSSIRPANGEAREVADIWMVERAGAGWGEPLRLDASTSEDDLYPSVDADGNLYFASPTTDPDRPDIWNILVARSGPEGYADPEPIPGQVNSGETWEFNPAISSDGTLLLFTRLDPANAQATGFGEIHASRLEGRGWTEPQKLGSAVNTELDEYHPSLSPDEQVLYFIRRDPFADDANGDIYRIRLDSVLEQG